MITSFLIGITPLNDTNEEVVTLEINVDDDGDEPVVDLEINVDGETTRVVLDENELNELDAAITMAKTRVRASKIKAAQS